MYSLIIKQFIRSRTVQLTFLLILIMSVVSILIGKQFLTRQESTIARVTQHQREHIDRNVDLHDEMGLLLYYLRFSLIDQPDKLTALSIGQRDINPSIQSVTIRTLEAQKYDTDLNNPSTLQSGNLDLGFVIIYLFPLVVIVFSFNLLSEESETGTWRLVAVQSKSTLRFLLEKLSVRAVLLYAVLGLLFIVAILVLSLPINEALTGFMIVSVLYLAFWFAFCFWVVSFHRSSSFNVLVLLSVWVVLAILLPASVNSYVANKYPVPEALGTIIKQRDGYHEKWDMDKKITMDKFYTHYPEFKKYGVPGEAFSWSWYYAMQQMGDDESVQESKAMHKKIMQREKASRSLAVVIPTMHTQLLFNDIARTSLRDYMRLLDRTNAFHEQLRLYFYPKIFENASVKNEDWRKFKPEYVSRENDLSWTMALVPLLIIIAVISLAAAVNLRKLKTI
jgi:ABC-2 type transport system permease protein